MTDTRFVPHGGNSFFRTHFLPSRKNSTTMQVNWRWINAARNTYAVLYAACERDGIILNPVHSPAGDVTCYSLNSINAPGFRDEIAAAECLTIVGGPHATACPAEVAMYADYVVVGEGEYTLPRLLEDLAGGGEGHIPGVMTGDWYEPADTGVRLDAYPAFSEMKGYVEITRGCPHACGYCATPQIFGHCMRHRSVDEVARWANRHSQVRFVSPNAFAYGSDGIHPRWDKVERLLRACTGPDLLRYIPERGPAGICLQRIACARHAGTAPTQNSISVPSPGAMPSSEHSAAGTPLPMYSVPSTSAGTTP